MTDQAGGRSCGACGRLLHGDDESIALDGGETWCAECWGQHFAAHPEAPKPADGAATGRPAAPATGTGPTTSPIEWRPCSNCGHMCSPEMQTCPSCGGEPWGGGDDIAATLEKMAQSGQPSHSAAAVGAAADQGASFSVERGLAMVTVYCPTCKGAHSAPESLVGKWAQCKHCGAKFQIQSGVPDPRQAPPAGKTEQLARVPAQPTAPGSAGQEGLQIPPSAAGAKRPFGLVWVVFYWVITGALLLVGGYVLSVMGGALGGALGEARDMFDSRNLRASALAMAILEFVGLLVFHLGLLTLVACYGLWTFRRWGLSLARGLAVAYVLLNVVVLIVCIASRAGIVASVVGLVISGGILVYLYGSTGLRDRLQRYLRVGRLQESEWQGFE